MASGRRFDAAALKAAKVVAGAFAAGALIVACSSGGSSDKLSGPTSSRAPGASLGSTRPGLFSPQATTVPGQTGQTGQPGQTTPFGSVDTTVAPGGTPATSVAGAATTVAGSATTAAGAATTAPPATGSGTTNPTSPPTTRTTQTSLVF